MIMECSHCKYLSNNYRFCEGCGREIEKPVITKFEELPEGSTRFLDEAVKAVEKIFFPDNSIESARIDIGAATLNIHEIVKVSGIYIIDDMQWQSIGNDEKKGCFFKDVFLLVGLSFIFVAVAALISAFSLPAILKFWISGFIFISFTLWFIFPFLSGATVFSISKYRSGLFTDNKYSVKGTVYPLILLFLFMQLYIFLPFLIVEYLISVKKPEYIPFAIKVAGVDFLMRTGGDY